VSNTSSTSDRAALTAAMTQTMRTFMAHAVLFQDAVAKSVGLNSTDLQCANLLLMHGPATPGQLADRAGITAGGAVTTVIDRLELAGLVHRTRDTVDRRRVMITADADELWRRVGPSYRRIAQQWDDYLATLTDEQISFANDLLQHAAELNRAETQWLRENRRT
jgi:DNA-binding MarR family transcriptional regulator